MTDCTACSTYDYDYDYNIILVLSFVTQAGTGRSRYIIA